MAWRCTRMGKLLWHYKLYILMEQSNWCLAVNMNQKSQSCIHLPYWLMSVVPWKNGTAGTITYFLDYKIRSTPFHHRLDTCTPRGPFHRCHLLQLVSKATL